MKPETLDSLLIDRAAGELPSDVSDLLDAYLVQNPPEAQRAQKLTLTFQQAQRAVAMTPKPFLPPLAVARLRPAARSKTGMTWVHEGARLAACLVAGMALGWLVHAASAGQKNATETKMAMADSRLAMRADLPERSAATAGFWSIDALAAAHPRNPPAPHYRLHWTSPLTKPIVEEMP